MRSLEKLLGRPAVLIVAFLTAAGCGTPAGDDRSVNAGAGHGAGAVQLISVSVDEWHEEIEALRGEIVVSDMWATWCSPCLERFPHMVELARHYQGRGVRFVSTCLDDPGDEQAVAYARRFLEEQGATFPNYLITENIADSFEELDLMTLPAVYIYGRDGELAYRGTADDPNDQFTDQDVEDAIEELLKE